MNNQLTMGIVGAGGFAQFAAQSFLTVEGIRIKAIHDVDEITALRLAGSINALYYEEYDQLLADKDIELIYIATPPFLHAEQSKKALDAGKHVICEKPAAIKTSDAEELAAFSRQNNLLYTVNLMQRYNPLYDIVKMIIDEKWLGDFVHGFFENYASDEKLVPSHWFWDETKSGGIFIEHAVHFYDMFRGWLGEGKLEHAMMIARDGTNGDVIDRVQSVVLYDNNPVTFYHGFNQPKVLDRQELRLQFDRGDITLYEWVPVKIRMHGLFNTPQVDRLIQLFPDASIRIHGDPLSQGRTATGKFREIRYDALITLTSGNISAKMDRYQQLLVAMITDQWKWIKSRSHKRKIDDTNAVESLRIAEESTLKAVRI